MALSQTARNSLLLRNFYLLNFKFIRKYLSTQQENLISLESDVLDNFTTQLMQRKSNKWELIKSRQKLNAEHVQIKGHPAKHELVIDLNEIDNILRNAIEVDDVVCITKTIEACIKHKTLPCMSNLLAIFAHFANNGDKSMVLNLMELSKLLDSHTLTKYSHFKHYLAQATWVKGNVGEAIVLFGNIYSSNVYLRRVLRNMLKPLLIDSTINQSETVLFMTINFAKKLGNNFGDFYALACIWKCCILSEWFSDQNIALELLEQNEGLRKSVIDNISHIVLIALKAQQIDLVYRILEVLMKCELKSHYRKVVDALFDYKVNKRDLQGCMEIVQWCRVQDINLSPFQEEQYVNLLLHTKSRPKVQITVSKISKPPDYNFKF